MNTVTSDKQGELLQLGTFCLGEEEFGVDLLKLREILRIMPITKVPCADGFVEGAINLRGVIIPIVNLRARFGLPGKAFDGQTRIINMDVNGLVIGFIVDSVGQVRRIPAKMVEPPPPVIASMDSEYIIGVVDFNERLLILLDIDKLISPELLDNFSQL